MKRQGDKSASQPAVKKSDGNMSTDFRLKIGAKLQTLLNGLTPDKRLFPRSRKQIYADLFGETQHSQIIIDPTIVIKSEPDTEENSNDTTSFNSENFLLSAKTRITALLNKQDGANKFPFKNKEKENVANSSTSSSKRPNHSHSQTRSQSSLNTTLNKKRKLSSSRGESSEPSTNQVRLKKLSVVVEDIMNSKRETRSSHLLPTQHVENENCSENVESNTGYLPPISEFNMDIAVSNNETDEVPEPFVSSEDVECIIDDSGFAVNQLSTDPHLPTDEYNSNEINSQLYALTPESSKIGETSGSLIVDDSNPTSNVMTLGENLEETSNQFSCSMADDSELVDDPDADHAVMSIANDSLMTKSSHEPEVVLLCVKKPTHEVITLEDDNDSELNIIEEVHECVQCGKAFRAKSLLNFHIRMHGSDSSSSPSSSS